MDKIIDSCGNNAGKIWRVLNSEGPLSLDLLIEKTGLTEEDIHSAIGWLSREDKVYQLETTFGLGNTNLTSKIGKDAGKVWRVLDTWGEVDLLSISRLARIDKSEVLSAIGWLAKENKVKGNGFQNNKKIKFWLK